MHSILRLSLYFSGLIIAIKKTTQSCNMFNKKVNEYKK